MCSLVLLPLWLACTGGGDDTAKDTDTHDTDTSEVDPVCTEPAELSCVDEMILDLSLHDDEVSDGEVTTTVEGDSFVTEIDASAGGSQGAADNPWVYVRFTADGAERVDIDDETALEDMTWDMSLRRFIVRLNGGTSGPSCVGAAAMIGFAYDDLTEVPDGVAYQVDDFYGEDCVLVNDSSGLPGSPQVAMGPWWSYSTCVSTTGTPFLVQQADGHVLKLVVEAYYGDDQAACNEDGASSEESGHFILRWSYLE